MKKKKAAAPTPPQQVILVLVEGGIVQEVTTRANQNWEVFDWDDFEDCPLDYWEERGEEIHQHIQKCWPELNKRIQKKLTKAHAELAEEEAEKTEQARIASREHYVIEFQHAETMNVFRTEADLTPEEFKQVQARLTELEYPPTKEQPCITHSNIEKPSAPFRQDFEQLLAEINQEIGTNEAA